MTHFDRSTKDMPGLVRVSRPYLEKWEDGGPVKPGSTLLASALSVNIMPVACPDPLSVCEEGLITTFMQRCQGQALGHPVWAPSTEATSGAVLDLPIPKISFRIRVKF